MLVREAIVANTDPALEADVVTAAEAMLRALETLEYRRSDGKVGSYCDVEQGRAVSRSMCGLLLECHRL